MNTRAVPEPSRDPARPGPVRPKSPPAQPAEGPALVHELLYLQRTVGNRAVGQLLGQTRDALTAAHPETTTSPQATTRQETTQHPTGHPPSSAQPGAGVHEVLRSQGRPLAAGLRAEMEARLGADFSAVRLHTGPAASQSAAHLGAQAYTSGSHVVLGSGGADRRTLAHELTHVIQQRQGPVAGVDNGAGLAVSDPGDRFERAAEANAARVLAGPAPVASAPPADAAPEPGAVPAVQRRTARALWEQAYGAEAPEGLSLPSDLETLLKEYDALDDSDLNRQQSMLGEIGRLLDEPDRSEELDRGTPGTSGRLREIVRVERESVAAELTVLAAYTRDADGPYELMADRGLLWDEWARSGGETARGEGESGRDYFARLSAANRQALESENAGQTGTVAEWAAGMRDALAAELHRYVLRHYTDGDRMSALARTGDLRSRAAIEVEGGGLHNTPGYDQHVLANTGFVFFFIEPAGAPPREQTRFGDLYIEVPLAESGLLNNGWVMLTDFYRRDFPVLMADPDDPAAIRSGGAFEAGTTAVRDFQRGTGAPPPSPEQQQRRAGMTQERRGQYSQILTQLDNETTAQQRYFPPNVLDTPAAPAASAQTRGRGRGGTPRPVRPRPPRPPEATITRPELLQQNMLVGPDIIPGLVERALAEVARISETNPEVGAALRGRDATRLAAFLLRDVVRVQAMVPIAMRLSAANFREPYRTQFTEAHAGQAGAGGVPSQEVGGSGPASTQGIEADFTDEEARRIEAAIEASRVTANAESVSREQPQASGSGLSQEQRAAGPAPLTDAERARIEAVLGPPGPDSPEAAAALDVTDTAEETTAPKPATSAQEGRTQVGETVEERPRRDETRTRTGAVRRRGPSRWWAWLRWRWQEWRARRAQRRGGGG